MLLKDYTNNYISYMERMNRHPHTIACTKIALKVVIAGIGDKDVASLKVTDSSYIIERGSLHGKYGASRAIIALRGFLKYLHDDGVALSVHYSDFKVPYVIDKEVEYLNKEEREIIRNCINLNSPAGLRFRTMFELMLRTGLRISEALSIRIDEVDFLNHQIKIINCKNKKQELVYIYGCEEWIKKYLLSRTDKNPFLFVSTNGSTLSFDAAKSHLLKFRSCLKGKLHKTFHWHILRKTFCTELLLAKTDIKSTQYLARHASERTTLRHYAAVNKKYCKEEHERVMGVLE